MTESINPNQPLPENVMIVGDDGLPDAVVHLDTVIDAATRLMYDMAVHSGDEAALAEVSARYLDEVGVELFGYVNTVALKLMTTYILEPLLTACDTAGLALRAGIAAAAEHVHAEDERD